MEFYQTWKGQIQQTVSLPHSEILCKFSNLKHIWIEVLCKVSGKQTFFEKPLHWNIFENTVGGVLKSFLPQQKYSASS